MISNHRKTSAPIPVDYLGHPCIELVLPTGDVARVALQGAQVLSWQTADGREHLYLSPKAAQDGRSPIRGGIPICFPQFNQRVLGTAALPKHGFARAITWQNPSLESTTHSSSLTLELSHEQLPERLSGVWPNAFAATLAIELTPHRLQVTFRVQNTGLLNLRFALALHTYLRISDIDSVQLAGLQDQIYWDAVEQPGDAEATRRQSGKLLRFTGETDRVYQQVPHELSLIDGEHSLQIAQSSNLTETVVWNPGRELGRQLDDLAPDGYRKMLCVEAAKINASVELSPQQHWEGWQQLTATRTV
jgi:glucose-6-phosphate 1-epimerase